MRKPNMDTPFLEKCMLGDLCLCFKLYLAKNKTVFSVGKNSKTL